MCFSDSVGLMFGLDLEDLLQPKLFYICVAGFVILHPEVEGMVECLKLKQHLLLQQR